MVSWEALGSATGVLVGVGLLAFGILSLFAAGMSTNPSESGKVVKSGCGFIVVGLVVTVAALGTMIFT